MILRRPLPRALLSVTLMSLALAGCGGGGGSGTSTTAPGAGSGGGSGGSGGGTGGGTTAPATLTLEGGEERFVTRATDVSAAASSGARSLRAPSTDSVDRLKTGDRVFREGDTSYFILKQISAGSYKVILPNGSEIALTWDATALDGAGAYTFNVTTGTTRVTYYLAVAANRITGVTLSIADISDPANPQELGEVAVEVQEPPTIPASVVGTYPASAFGSFFGSSNATVTIDEFGVMTVRKPGEEPVIYQMAVDEDGKIVAQASYLEEEVQNTDGGAPEASPGDLASDKFVFGTLVEDQPLDIEELVYEAMPQALFEEFFEAVIAGEDAELIAEKLALLEEAAFEEPVEVVTPPSKLDVDLSTVEALAKISGAYVLRQTAGTFPAGVDPSDLEDQDGLTWLAYLGVDGSLSFYDAEAGWDASWEVADEGITISETQITIDYVSLAGDGSLTLTATKGSNGAWSLAASQENVDGEVVDETFTYDLSPAPALSTLSVGLRVTEVNGTHFNNAVDDVIAAQFDGAIFLVVGGESPVGITLREVDATTLVGARVEDRGEEGVFQEVFTVTLADGVPVSGIVRAYAVTEVENDVVVGTEVIGSMAMVVDALPDTAGVIGTYVLRDQSFEQLSADEDPAQVIGNSVAIADLYPDNSLGLWEAESQEWSLLEHPVPGETEGGLKTLTWLKPQELSEARITAVLAADGQGIEKVTWVYESFVEGDEDYGDGRDAGTLSATKVTTGAEAKGGVLTVTEVTLPETETIGAADLDLPQVGDLAGLSVVPGGIFLDQQMIPAAQGTNGTLVAQWTEEPVTVRALPIHEELPAGGVAIEGSADMTGVHLTREGEVITVSVDFAGPITPSALVPGKSNARISMLAESGNEQFLEFMCWSWSNQVHKHSDGQQDSVVNGSTLSWSTSSMTFTLPASELPTTASLRLEVFYWNSDADSAAVDEVDLGDYDLNAETDVQLPAVTQILTLTTDTAGRPTSGTMTFHAVTDRVASSTPLATVSFTVAVPDETLVSAVDAFIDAGGVVGFITSHLVDGEIADGVDLGGSVVRLDLADLPSPSQAILKGGLVATTDAGTTSTVSMSWREDETTEVSTVYTIANGMVTGVDQTVVDPDTGEVLYRKAGTFTTLPTIADGWYTMTLTSDVTFVNPQEGDEPMTAGMAMGHVQFLNGYAHLVWFDDDAPFSDPGQAVVTEAGAAVSRVVDYDLSGYGQSYVVTGLWVDRMTWTLGEAGVVTGFTIQPQEAPVVEGVVGDFADTLVNSVATFSLTPAEFTPGAATDAADLPVDSTTPGLDILGFTAEGVVPAFSTVAEIAMSVTLAPGEIPAGSTLRVNFGRQLVDSSTGEGLSLPMFSIDYDGTGWFSGEDEIVPETDESGNIHLAFSGAWDVAEGWDLRGTWAVTVLTTGTSWSDVIDLAGPALLTIADGEPGPGHENLAVVDAFQAGSPKGLVTTILVEEEHPGVNLGGQTLRFDPSDLPTRQEVQEMGGSLSYSPEGVVLTWSAEGRSHQIAWSVSNGQVVAVDVSERDITLQELFSQRAGTVVDLPTVANGWYRMTVAAEVSDLSTDPASIIPVGTDIGLVQVQDGFVHAFFEESTYTTQDEPTALVMVDGQVQSRAVSADYTWTENTSTLDHVWSDKFLWTVSNGVLTAAQINPTEAAVVDGVLGDLVATVDPAFVPLTLTPAFAPVTANASADDQGDSEVATLDIVDTDFTGTVQANGDLTMVVDVDLALVQGDVPAGTIIDVALTRLVANGNGDAEELPSLWITFDGTSWQCDAWGQPGTVTVNVGTNRTLTVSVTVPAYMLQVNPVGNWLFDLETGVEDQFGAWTSGDRTAPRYVPVTAAVAQP